MSSDEDDYMSAAFIVDSAANDIRPGLLHNRQQQRSHEIYKKKQAKDAEIKEKQQPIRVIEAQRREEGLQEAIDSSNKGFALLQKMGYKPGTALGKSGSGSVEPISIQLKSDRKGLGRDAAIEELKEAKRLYRARRKESSKSEVVSVEQYRARLKQKSDLRLTEIDLFKSQKACHQLDTEGGYTEPAEPWFWPKVKKPNPKSLNDEVDIEPCGGTCQGHSQGEPASSGKDSKSEESEEEEDEDDFEASEKLEMLTKYLRCTYNYCIWCCVKFDDEKDMQNDCPGATRDDH